MAKRKKAKRGGAKKKAKKKAAPKKKAAKKKAAPKEPKLVVAEAAGEALRKYLDKKLEETKPDYRPCPRPKPAVMPISSLRVARSAREDVGEISELADSIRANGLLVPLVVSPEGEVLDGRRRLEALRDLDITEVPVVVVGDGASGHVVEIVTNVMRKDLTPGERARAYQVAMRVLHLTQAKLGEMIGVTQAAISKAIAVLSPPIEEDITAVISGEEPPESPEEDPPETIVDKPGEARKRATEERQAERKAEGGKPRGKRPEWKQQDKELLPTGVVSLKAGVDKIRITADLDWPVGTDLDWRGVQLPKTMAVSCVTHCRTLRERLLLDLNQGEE